MGRSDRQTGGARAVALAACVAGAAACGTQPKVSAESPPAVTQAHPAIETIDSAGVRARIAVIADDSMGGRATPSRGLDMTARYVARELESFGLEPAFDSGYIQTYSTNGSAAAPNVAAVLRGSDPTLRDTYVVFSAHMDHVGTGAPDATGDSIYNGADDDASGTAAVIEIAEAFARLDPAPGRSVIFLTVSGEEGGLWGSQAFVEKGGIPTGSMAANVNIDMIGRNASDSVVAIGIRYSDMGERIGGIASAHPDLGLTVVDDPWPDERFFFRSDHYNFASAGVPAIFLFAGTHADYHMPSDEADLIDADKIARIARLAFRLGLDIANDPVEPQWTREGLLEVRPPNRN
jgi:Zn-dependent M28 family amino/carboxypeptidase